MRVRKELIFCAIGLATAATLGIGNWLHPQATEAQPAPATVEPTASPSPASPVPIKPDVPYVPTPEPVVLEMLKLAGVSQGDVVYDLGSGDGRLVINAVQKFGAKKGVGVEINPGLVQRSTENAKTAGVTDRVQFLQQDLFKTNFSEASVVTLYLLPEINERLRPKLLNELKPGTRIVSHSFSMGDWKPDRKVLVPPDAPPQRILYYWVVPAKIAGNWKGSIAYAPGRNQPYTLQFTQQYQQVKGNVLADGKKFAIPQISLTGDRLTFSRTETIQGQQVTAVFTGRVEGDTLKGAVEVKGGLLSRQFPVVAKRNGARQALSP